MQIQLDIINKNGLQEGIATRFAVGDAPQVIGRGKKAGWVLPDASRFLSSSHCRIVRDRDGFQISVLSANGIVLNGRSVGQGKDARLANGDRLEIGPYFMIASLTSAAADSGEKTIVLGRRAAAAVDERTVIQAPKNPAGFGAKSETAPVGHKPAVRTGPRHPMSGRAPAGHAAASSHALGVDFVRAFTEGAGIDPEHLAGRTNLEFARDAGGAMRQALNGLGALSRSAGELRTLVGSREKQRGRLLEESALDALDGDQIFKALFGAAGPGHHRADQAAGDLAEDLQSHDSAFFHAMQTALFRLLNEISPMAVEAATGAGVMRSKRAKNWSQYVRKWESMSLARENGMLDVFLEYFREAYDDKISGR